MVDADILRSKTARILHHCERLEARSCLDGDALARDEDLRNALLMDLQQAIQSGIDLAVHACVDDGFGTPTTAARAFASLAEHGLIDADLARALTGAAGLRNLIVHQYVDIDLDRVMRVVREDLDDLRAFVKVLHGRRHAP